MKKAINQGKIRVRTPQTTDGVNVAFDDEEKIVYKETILPASARKHLESLNANLPAQLRSKIEDVKPDVPKAIKPEVPAPPKAPEKKKKKADEEIGSQEPESGAGSESSESNA